MSGEKQKILLVDDDADLVTALSAILSNGGYDVISSPNGTIGLETAKRVKPNLIIIDIMMDTYSEGFIFVKNLLADEETRDIPRVLLSSLGIQQGLDMVYPEELGAKLILKKPVKSDVLLSSVKSVIGG